MGQLHMTCSILLAIAFCPFFTGSKVDADYSEQIALVRERVKDVVASESPSLKSYEEFAKGLLDDGEDRTSDQTAHLTRAICVPLAAGLFKDNRQFQVAIELAHQSLKSKNLSVLAEIDLVRFGGQGSPMLQLTKLEKEFRLKRTADAKLWLRAWKRYDESLDQDWDPDEQLSIHPEPPPGIISWSSGASPQQIKDPALRAEYEKRLAENQRKIEQHTLQHMLRNRLNQFPRECESHLIDLYRHAPSNITELEKLLRQYEIEKSIVARITEAVAREN